MLLMAPSAFANPCMVLTQVAGKTLASSDESVAVFMVLTFIFNIMTFKGSRKVCKYATLPHFQNTGQSDVQHFATKQSCVK